LLWCAVVLSLAVACRKGDKSQSAQGNSAPKANELPPLDVRKDTPNLLITWIDEKGDFHVVQKPDDVPAEARKQVRIVVTTREEGTGKLVYVADLNEQTPDGAYRLKTMTRAQWDELGASRRKARLEALAPPANSGLVAEGDAGTKQLPIGSVVAIIYGAEWCKPCHDAARYLKQRGINVVSKDIEENAVAASEMRQKLARAGKAGSQIPVIDVMGHILIGFSPSALDRAIEAAQSSKPL
jgi:glutaredoxin